MEVHHVHLAPKAHMLLLSTEVKVVSFVKREHIQLQWEVSIQVLVYPVNLEIILCQMEVPYVNLASLVHIHHKKLEVAVVHNVQKDHSPIRQQLQAMQHAFYAILASFLLCWGLQHAAHVILVFF